MKISLSELVDRRHTSATGVEVRPFVLGKFASFAYLLAAALAGVEEYCASACAQTRVHVVDLTHCQHHVKLLLVCTQ